MRLILLILVITSLWVGGCMNAAHNRHLLNLKDLKFPNPEKEAIVRNHIAEIIGFDTTRYHHYDRTYAWYSKIHPWHNDIDKVPTDSMMFLTIEWAKFDSAGNRIYYKRHEDYLCGTHNTNVNFTFDSLGFKITGSGYRKDTFFYIPVPGSNSILVIRHMLWERYKEEQRIIVDTSLWYFDSLNRIKIEIDSWGNKKEYKDTTTYNYDSAGRLTLKTKHISGPRDIKPYKDYEPRLITVNYAYRGDNLDSVIYDYNYSWDSYNYKDKFYYNSDGLVYKSILDYYSKDMFNDGKTISIDSRKLVLYYRYKKFNTK